MPPHSVFWRSLSRETHVLPLEIEWLRAALEPLLPAPEFFRTGTEQSRVCRLRTAAQATWLPVGTQSPASKAKSDACCVESLCLARPPLF